MPSNEFQELLTIEVYNKVWDSADDVIETSRTLGDLYEKVPEDLKDIEIKVLEIHSYPKEHRERVSAFVNNEYFSNPLNFIKSEDQ